jgi:hypothetical protein
VQAFEAHQFDVIAERSGTAGTTRATVHHDVRGGWSVLRAHGTDAEQQSGGQRGTGQTFAIHLFSPLLSREVSKKTFLYDH